MSILAEDQAGLAQRYAARGDSQLDRADFRPSAAGLPVIDRALGHFECRTWSTHLAGDHTMIFGEVTGLSPKVNGTPLAFFNGQFCSIGM